MEEFEIQTELASEGEQPGETGVVIPIDAAEEASVPPEPPAVSVDDLLPGEPNLAELPVTRAEIDDTQLRAALEAIVYVTEEPVTVAQLAAALQQPPERIQLLLTGLAAEFEKPEHGLTVKEVAGGYKMATKAEHHETVRAFAKSLKAPLKLSLPALETLAVVAYKQPVTSPEIMEIRGVQGTGVLKTLLDRKLIATAGRKNVIGKPILYKTTKEFLVQFGLKDLNEMPALKEFEEIRRLAFMDEEPGPGEAAADAEPAAEASETPEAEAAAAPVAETSEASPAEVAADAEPQPPADEPEEPASSPEPGQDA